MSAVDNLASFCSSDRICLSILSILILNCFYQLLRQI
ncbi:hypothetical protein VPMS16_2191 [Vibrio sp. 16]|nr:hypothetical protein VPMS16_2191 [Vibrio sp. 16]